MKIKIGHYNWAELAAKGTFYPDDLPEEWQLSFYANEFECVALDLSQFTECETLAEWVDDLPDTFDLLVMATDDKQWQLLECLLNEEDVNIKTILCDEPLLELWKEKLNQLSVRYLSYPAEAVELGNKKVGYKLADKKCEVVFIEQSQTLKQWRAIVDQWLSNQSNEENYLLLNAQNVTAGELSNLRMMIEMMGY
ncbi:MAG: hypothetical protein ISR69_12355 [Gammaproteobacteria bacterium]|nr:hypothetical protein [Gammaproteobacteria bacterium]